MDPEFLAAGVRPTMWLQSGSDRLREIAAFKPGEALTDRKKMEALGGRVSRIMKTLDFNGHYSALEAAERGVGDCAEDAVLLAALARAAGIPAYVATGLVYSRERYHGVSNVFAPHNWVLAFVDGEWASFDISLGDFDATHIALSVNEGEASAMASAQQLASHLEWRRMVEVQQAPSSPQ
jgi:transglutaminase-like putative cysteine protease